MRTYSIVGMNYIKTEDIVAALKPGTAVILIRDPGNEHDKNAIAVWAEVQGADYRKVGYIPKKQNFVLAQFIDQNGVGSMAFDGVPTGVRSIPARFVRSPHSGYPLVEV